MRGRPLRSEAPIDWSAPATLTTLGELLNTGISLSLAASGAGVTLNAFRLGLARRELRAVKAFRLVAISGTGADPSECESIIGKSSVSGISVALESGTSPRQAAAGAGITYPALEKALAGAGWRVLRYWKLIPSEKRRRRRVGRPEKGQKTEGSVSDESDAASRLGRNSNAPYLTTEGSFQ